MWQTVLYLFSWLFASNATRAKLPFPPKHDFHKGTATGVHLRLPYSLSGIASKSELGGYIFLVFFARVLCVTNMK